MLIGPHGTTSCDILSKIIIFSLTKMSVKVSSAKWRPFCFGLNVLRCTTIKYIRGQLYCNPTFYRRLPRRKYNGIFIDNTYHIIVLSTQNAMSRATSGAATRTCRNLPWWLAKVWGFLLPSIPWHSHVVASCRGKLPDRGGKPCPPGYNHKLRKFN